MEIKIIYRNWKYFGEDMTPAHVLYTPLKPPPKIQTLNLINLVEPVYIRLQFCNYLYFFFNYYYYY
jgi:hypothetical protein